MATIVVLQAYDAKGNWLDISGKTREELFNGESDSVIFDYDELGSAGKILKVVNTLRSATLWDWNVWHDGADGKPLRKRIAYFQLRHQTTLMESFLTPWGKHCQIELPGRVTSIRKKNA